MPAWCAEGSITVPSGSSSPPSAAGGCAGLIAKERTAIDLHRAQVVDGTTGAVGCRPPCPSGAAMATLSYGAWTTGTPKSACAALFSESVL